MTKIRKRFLFIVIVAADLTIVLGGIPLLRDTYSAIELHAGDARLFQLLIANLSLMLLVVAAMAAWGALGRRLLSGGLTYSPISSALPIPGLRTRYRR